MKNLSEALRDVRLLLGKIGFVQPPDEVWLLELPADAPTDERGRVRVRAAELVQEGAYASRFEELLSIGPAWLNVSCYGVHEGRLIVAIELPAAPLNRGLKTAVNVSGPTHAGRANGWTVDDVLDIER